MRLIVWGINYHPEPTGIAPYNSDLCDFLEEQGHSVEMISSFRYYPYWERLQEDQWSCFRTDLVGKIRVHRCWCYLPKHPNTLKRIFHELSFCVLSFMRILVLKRPDALIVISPPLALGFFAWLAGKIKRCPFVFHVQDLQPDAALGLGMLKPGILIKCLYRLEAFAYRKAARVSSISTGILKAFEQKGVPEFKRFLVPNWLRVKPSNLAATQEGTKVRQKFGIPTDALLALYSGNIGKKQNIGILVEAARLLAKNPSDREIIIVIAGDGAGRAELVKSLNETPCQGILLLPLLQDADYAAMLGAAQLCLITQAAGTGQYFFPSKLLSALCARVPVIAVADSDSELSQAVAAGGFGAVVSAEKPSELSELLQSLALDANVLTSWKSHTQWVDQFARERILPQFEAKLKQLCHPEAASQ